jgi:TetR/AcrR family transcriptional repressor of bet genes
MRHLHAVRSKRIVALAVWTDNQAMGRPSVRTERRAELTTAFARVLAEHGYAGATIAAVAAEAGVAPGLVHHHFQSKADLMDSLLTDLLVRLRARTHARQPRDGELGAWVAASLALDDGSDVVAARCWVGVFAEAVRDPKLFERVRRLVDAEIVAIRRRSGHLLDDREAGGVLAFVIGALVLGAFAPRKTAGFAAPTALRLVDALMGER